MKMMKRTRAHHLDSLENQFHLHDVIEIKGIAWKWAGVSRDGGMGGSDRSNLFILGLSLSLTLSLTHSLSHSLSHSLTLDLLNSFVLTVRPT